MEVHEGGLEFEVPEEGAIFYNPAMELNRDLTVAFLRVARGRFVPDDGPTYLDAMTAAGVRGARAAAAGYRTTVCDVNDAALAAARRNLARNGLEAEAHLGDVRAHLHGASYDVVDLDPFGSPVPFVDAAIDGARGVLCVTATDTAPLCGAHLAAGRRRYAAEPRPTAYHPEVGLRVLLGNLVRRAAARDVAARPVLSHATRHYHRTYLDLDDGATEADRTLEAVGFVVHCPACLHREPVAGLAPALPATCPRCEATVERIGPLWLGRYVDAEVAEAAIEALDGGMDQRTPARRLLERLAGEIDRVTHLDHHELCDRWDVTAAPIEAVLEALRGGGHAASRTHFGGTTFKTDAPMGAVRAAVVELAESA
ncbi:MAG: tRNA (guanine(26)-N(2))-dimethyltransferase [Halobacteriales archaeon]